MRTGVLLGKRATQINLLKNKVKKNVLTNMIKPLFYRYDTIHLEQVLNLI